MTQNRHKGKLAVISGFSGAGKGTIIKSLLEKYGNYVLSISMTTRKPRDNEVNGVNYFFVSNDEFERAIKEDGLLEYAGYVDHYYGTPRAFVEKKLEEGRDVILEIEVQGALQVKEKYPEAILIFVAPPTAAELERRLTGRGTESAQDITKRLQQALVETERMADYGYLAVNDDLDSCVREVDRIIQTKPDGRNKDDAAFAGKFIRDLSDIIEKRTSEN